MLIINLIIVILTIILQYLNTYSITKTLKAKDRFMYLHLISNDYVHSTIKPYKMKMLMYNRILLLVTIVIAPFFIWLNNSNILLVLYILIFLLIPFIVNQYYINKTINEFKNLNIAHDNQIYDINYLGLLYSSNDNSTIVNYGVLRYAINIASIKGKLLVAAIISALIILFAALLIFVKPVDSNAATIDAELTTTNITIKYDEKNTTIPIKDITAIEKVKDLPRVVNKVDGVQENGYIVGIFNLQGYNNANIYIKKTAQPYLLIKAKNKYYFYSEENGNNMNTIYDTIVKQLATKKK